MNCPSFQILDYGIFDSRIAFPRLTQSPARKLNRFELELFIDDLGGVSYIGETGYPLKRGLFLCGKPGQTRHSQLPIYCHYVHLRTEDPQLLQILHHLPDSCLLSDPAPVQSIFRELASHTGDDLLTAGLVLKLLSILQQTTAVELRSHHAINRSHRATLMETEAYIRNHLTEDLSLESLATRAQFSPSHFHRIFTAFFNQPPHEFITQCRIEAAQSALRSNESSLIDLAAACGFSSQSHFSAQFKKSTGQTPLQYRKTMLSRLKP